MAGGSVTRDTDDDRQCRHCGRWYSRRGVLSHEEACDMAEFDTRINALDDREARMRAEDVTLDDQGDGVEDRPAGVRLDEPVDDVGADPTPTGASPSVDVESEPTPATDGGPGELPEFGDAGDAGDDLGDQGETVDVESEPTPATDGGPGELPEFGDAGDAGDDLGDQGETVDVDVDVDEDECPDCGAGDQCLADANAVADALGVDDDHDVRDRDVACVQCSGIGAESVQINAFDRDEVAA